jgi:AcrR family transcriptional regulator
VRTKTPFLADKILDVAGRLFGTRRFHEVRMEDIAGEASVSKGTLYRYFADKEELYLALLSQASQQLIAQLRLRVEGEPTSRAALVAFVDAVIEFFDHRPHLFDLIQRAEVQHSQGGAFPWQAARDESARLIAEVFDAAKRDREFTLRHPSTAVLLLFGGLRAIVRFGERPRPATLASGVVDDFLQGAAKLGKPKPRKTRSHVGTNGTRKRVAVK